MSTSGPRSRLLAIAAAAAMALLLFGAERACRAAAPDTRQTVCFSATLPPPIRNLIERFTNDPATVTVASETVNAPDIEQVYYEVRYRSKPEVLSRLLDTHNARLSIVFCNTN